MARYFVGDIQGCFSELTALLAQAAFNPKKDELWLVGDVVARGPDSLSTIRFLKSLGSSAKMVLGNHDLHLLSIHAGIKKAKKQDLLDELLNQPDIDELMDWLATQPLIRKIPNENAYMSHAGISPQWSITDALLQAKKAQKRLCSSKRTKWLTRMYGEVPNNWHKARTKTEKFRYTINALTRMRYCYADQTLEFDHKNSPEDTPKNLIPWFEMSKTIKTTTWVFGHWAALMGQCSFATLYALDTGCVWGNHLTMLRWRDKRIFIEHAHKKKTIKQ